MATQHVKVQPRGDGAAPDRKPAGKDAGSNASKADGGSVQRVPPRRAWLSFAAASAHAGHEVHEARRGRDCRTLGHRHPSGPCHRLRRSGRGRTRGAARRGGKRLDRQSCRRAANRRTRDRPRRRARSDARSLSLKCRFCGPADGAGSTRGLQKTPAPTSARFLQAAERWVSIGK
jgi:hypothetical protein